MAARVLAAAEPLTSMPLSGCSPCVQGAVAAEGSSGVTPRHCAPWPCPQPGTPAQDSHAFHLPWWFLWILLPLPGAVWACCS